MRLKKFISTCTLGALLATSAIVPTEVSAAGPVNIVINNVSYNNQGAPAPESINSRVYVPLRLVSEGLGYNVEWDGETRSVLIDSSKADIQSTGTVGSDVQIYVNGKQVKINASTGVPYFTPTGFTMVPVRLVAEELGADVVWNGESQSVIINTKDNNSSAPSEPSTPVIPSLPDTTPQTPPSNQGQATTKPQSASEVTLMGDSYCSLEQMQRYLDNIEVTVRNRAIANGKTFVPFPENIAAHYYNIAKKYNIRGDVALAQALLETGYFQYGNEVKPWQNNYCGLGAIGRVTTQDDLDKQIFSKVNHEKAYLVVGIHGWCYNSVASGVEAHIQHMYSYASAAPLPAGTELLDGRFAHGNRGKAIYLNDLNGKWAVPGHNYGENIFANMLQPMMNS